MEIPLPVLATVVAVLGLVVAGLLVGLTAGTALQRLRQRRRERLRAQLQGRVREVVVDGGGARAAARSMARLPWRAQVDELSQLHARLGGRAAEQVRGVARTTGLSARAHRWLGSRRWHRRHRGIGVLTLTGEGGPAVVPLLGDGHPEVRAQAADWVAEHGDAEQVAAMLAALIDDPELRGFVLVDALSRAGQRAIVPLVAALDRDDVDDPVPCLTVAAALGDVRFAAPGLRWSASARPPARAAAARLLAAVGTAAATERLVALLDDPAASVRAAAARGLARLRHWAAAPRLGRRLDDADEEVGRCAGLALRRLGPPGQLYLRRAARGEGAAGEIARAVLSLPREVVA